MALESEREDDDEANEAETGDDELWPGMYAGCRGKRYDGIDDPTVRPSAGLMTEAERSRVSPPSGSSSKSAKREQKSKRWKAEKCN